MKNTDLDIYFQNLKKWKKELNKLRDIVLECNLSEELKWRQPCYTHDGKNILIISGFKDYFAINFFKGSLLNDSDNILITQTENSQGSRQIRFSDISEIEVLKDTIINYINNAIEIEKSGKKIEYKKSSELEVPEELLERFKELPEFQEAFYNLTQGRQKGYLLFFTAAKQSKTRENRIEQYMPRIFDGKGINDCVCGLSKKMPSCDGSHKNINS